MAECLSPSYHLAVKGQAQSVQIFRASRTPSFYVGVCFENVWLVCRDLEECGSYLRTWRVKRDRDFRCRMRLSNQTHIVVAFDVEGVGTVSLGALDDLAFGGGEDSDIEEDPSEEEAWDEDAEEDVDDDEDDAEEASESELSSSDEVSSRLSRCTLAREVLIRTGFTEVGFDVLAVLFLFFSLGIPEVRGAVREKAS